MDISTYLYWRLNLNEHRVFQKLLFAESDQSRDLLLCQLYLHFILTVPLLKQFSDYFINIKFYLYLLRSFLYHWLQVFVFTTLIFKVRFWIILILKSDSYLKMIINVFIVFSYIFIELSATIFNNVFLSNIYLWEIIFFQWAKCSSMRFKKGL